MQPDSTTLNRTPQAVTRSALALLVALLLSTACTSPATSISKGNTPQQQRAMAMWQERCKKSGEFIHKTVEGVEGIYLVNVRTHEANENHGEQPTDQFRLSDPYGGDVTGEGYLESFLKGFFGSGDPKVLPDGTRSYPAFNYVEAYDPVDGKLYRYTGRIEEPWQYDKSYLKGYTRFVLDRLPVSQRTAWYGVKFEDISTREEREYWIAGSSLKVIDLKTQEVIAERIGYMVDWAQGSRAGGRGPWLLATDNACPAFSERPNGSRVGSVAQLGQTVRFVEKTLHPASQGSKQP